MSDSISRVPPIAPTVPVKPSRDGGRSKDRGSREPGEDTEGESEQVPDREYDPDGGRERPKIDEYV